MTSHRVALRYTRFWMALGFVWVGILLYACLTPVALPEQNVIGLDKLVHFAAFACLAGWFGALTPPGRAWLPLAGLILLGAAIEWLQGQTGYRDADGWDLLADSLGVVAGLLLSPYLGYGTLRYIERHVGADRTRSE